MNEIKIDVALVLEQSKAANDALENITYCVTKLRNMYSECLGDMKSNEFIEEFEESIEELLDQTEELSESSIQQIIEGLAAIAEVLEAADTDMSKM